VPHCVVAGRPKWPSTAKYIYLVSYKPAVLLALSLVITWRLRIVVKPPDGLQGAATVFQTDGQTQ